MTYDAQMKVKEKSFSSVHVFANDRCQWWVILYSFDRLQSQHHLFTKPKRCTYLPYFNQIRKSTKSIVLTLYLRLFFSFFLRGKWGAMLYIISRISLRMSLFCILLVLLSLFSNTSREKNTVCLKCKLVVDVQRTSSTYYVRLGIHDWVKKHVILSCLS